MGGAMFGGRPWPERSQGTWQVSSPRGARVSDEAATRPEAGGPGKEGRLRWSRGTRPGPAPLLGRPALPFPGLGAGHPHPPGAGTAGGDGCGLWRLSRAGCPRGHRMPEPGGPHGAWARRGGSWELIVSPGSVAEGGGGAAGRGAHVPFPALRASQSAGNGPGGVTTSLRKQEAGRCEERGEVPMPALEARWVQVGSAPGRLKASPGEACPFQ